PEAVYAGYASYPSAAVQQSTTTTLCAAVNSAFGLLIIGIFLFALIHLLQHLLQTPVLRRWILRAIARLGAANQSPIALEQSEPAADTARLWLRAILILSALALIVEYALSRRSTG